jgi:hypothetical protein
VRTERVVAEPEVRNNQAVIVGTRLSTRKSLVRLGRTLRRDLNPEPHKFETDRQQLISIVYLFVFLALQPTVVVFSQPSSGL